MSVVIRKASRKKAKLRLGIAAPGGAGKTMGSLFLAYGITKDWDKIGLIDTEEGSGELYAGTHKNGVTIGDYQYCGISAPYTVAKYIDAIKAMEQVCDVVIIDSLSHAWAGTGGLLDKQGKIADASKNSYTAWRFVTPEHTALVDSLLQSPRHIIATMRSKQEYVLEAGSNGKMAPRKVGMAPIQRDGMEYEFTVMFDINQDAIATATKDRTDLFSSTDGAGRIEKRQFVISPKIGEELAEWLNKGEESLDMLCEKMVADIKISTDLEAAFQKHAALIQRVKDEKPEWAGHITHLFEVRNQELSAVPT